MKKKLLYGIIFTIIVTILAAPFVYYVTFHNNSELLIDSQRFLWSEFMREIGKLALVIFISCLIGFGWSKDLGLAGLGEVEDLKKDWVKILISGVFIGFLVYIFGDRYFLRVAREFYPSTLKFALFVPFYAAFVEEVFARFGVMTLGVKILKNKYFASILAATIFAIGHVNLFRISGIVYRLNYLTMSSFILNFLLSLFFGYVYWRKGLVTAMGIHFIANLRYLFIAFWM